MILASLAEAAQYERLHIGFDVGFEFLRRRDLADLAVGRHAIDGDRIFALVGHDQGRGRAASPLEFHRRYIDIQLILAGIEVIGWLPTPECRELQSDYDSSRDIGFFSDRPVTWCDIAPGNFAIFFPTDAHAPLAGEGEVRKVVIKVAV